MHLAERPQRGGIVVAKARSKATKLAAVVLARLSSPEVAAATFRVDVQTAALAQGR